MTRYETFDRRRLRLAPVAERGHDFSAEQCLPPAAPRLPYRHEEFDEFVSRLKQALGAGPTAARASTSRATTGKPSPRCGTDWLNGL